MTAESATRPLRGASVAALAHNMPMKCLVQTKQSENSEFIPDSEQALYRSVIIGNVYGVCCPVNISTEHIEFSRLRKTESVTL